MKSKLQLGRFTKKVTIKATIKYALVIFVALVAVKFIKDTVNPNKIYVVSGDWGFITAFGYGPNVTTVTGKWIEGGRKCTLMEAQTGFISEKRQIFGPNEHTVYYSNLHYTEIIDGIGKNVYGDLITVASSKLYEKYQSVSGFNANQPYEAFRDCFEIMPWGDYKYPL